MKKHTKCSSCNKEFTKYANTNRKDKEDYCSRECYNSRRKKNLKRLKRSTKFYEELLETTPCKCGIKETYLLQIHHIDGNNKNHFPENLEVVCANCHVKRHLKLNKKGKLVYSPKDLTDRNILNNL